MTLPQKEIYINSTIAYCKHCGRNEMARIVARKTGVFMERLCSEKGVNSVKIAADYKWYMTRVTQPQIVSVNKNVRESKDGCPFDCGLCEWHSGRIQRVIISLTNDLHSVSSEREDSNRSNTKNYKNLAEIERIIDYIKERSDYTEIINLTGNDALLHPNLFKIIDTCKQAGFKRIVIDTDGFSIGEDFEFLEKIKQADVHLVLSLDTLDPEKSIKIHGDDITDKKLKTLQVSEALEIPMNILLVYIKGTNEEDISSIANEYIKKDFVRNIIVQNKSFLGRHYSKVQSSESIPIDDVEKLLSIGEDFSQENFSSLASYHSQCYSVAYYIVDNQRVIPLSNILDKNDLVRLSEKCCQLDPDKDFSRNFWDGINRLWSGGEDYDSMMVLKKFMEKIYPSGRRLSKKERWKIAEKMIKAVFIHHYMDKTNFDVDRVSRCGDVVIDESGKLIPVCSYSLLYHQ